MVILQDQITFLFKEKLKIISWWVIEYCTYFLNKFFEILSYMCQFFVIQNEYFELTEKYEENLTDERMLDSVSPNKKLVHESVTNSKVLDTDVTDKTTTTTKSILSSVENVGGDATYSNTTHVLDQTDINTKVNLQ